MGFSYEHYMNLIYHLDDVNESVPSDIAKRIVSNAIAPVMTVTSTAELDQHISETYNIDSLYMLFRFFGGCVSDRDQANECKGNTSTDIEKAPVVSDSASVSTDQTSMSGSAPVSATPASGSLDANLSGTKNNLTVPGSNRRARQRSNSNSLYQRDATQSQYVRFTRTLVDLVHTRDTNDMLFDHHSLEMYLKEYLKVVDEKCAKELPHKLLKESIYHSFFSLAISSTTILSPFESFNHPVVSLLAIDISKGETYEEASFILQNFKNMSKNVDNFPSFISTNDILPVFILCYNDAVPEQLDESRALANKLKKQLFVESIILPLWSHEYESDIQVQLHQPVMSSIEETIYFLQHPVKTSLSLKLINCLYDQIDAIVFDLMKPFMRRKLAFWEETILQPRKSLFHGSKFFKKFINKATPDNQQRNILTTDRLGNEYFVSSSPEFLMRKLADWSMMISDFKTAFQTYDSLCHDLEKFPKYLASCSEWCAVSLLMGAQSIVTVKMIKNDIIPALERALDAYDLCAYEAKQHHKKNSNDDGSAVRSYETRCLFLSSELFLSLSDTWTSTPYAILYLETILDECKLGPISEIMIWERLSDCYGMRVDPRIRHKVTNPGFAQQRRLTVSEDDVFTREDIISKGLTRFRKAALFRLIAARKWSEQKQWRQLDWCIQDLDKFYGGLDTFNQKDLLFSKLKHRLLENNFNTPYNMDPKPEDS
ncbi:hypothetical protein RNJ44_05000 [Nakaseomyces bracarensis]|uniref:Trafficking protein particle complex III-specific subunit 85 n=1 Tax=Nakaseomyces bracarensis TaxID=273131 RepID=A0ABR4NWH4_9SACH